MKESIALGVERIERLKTAVIHGGGLWCGIQETIPPNLPLLLFNSPNTRTTLAIPFDPEKVDSIDICQIVREKLKLSDKSFGEKKMTLDEKLIEVYKKVEFIEKRGYNKAQSYRFMRAADVTHALRKALEALKIYAEINFELVGAPYTVAREKAPNAPFTALNVRCSIVFRDTESSDTRTSSGVGSGCDTNDKAAYKAQTGALKYALKNAFLVPDESDPEADESVDEVAYAGSQVIRSNDEPVSFQEASHPAPKVNTPRPDVSNVTQPPITKVGAPAGVVPHEGELLTPPTAVSSAPAVNKNVEPANAVPTEQELGEYSKQFRILADELSTKGNLKASRGLPINRKLIAFFLQITGAADVKQATIAQWDDFFRRARAKYTQPEGMVEFARLVDAANGIETKKK